MVLVRLLVGSYQNSRLSSEYIYRRITPIVRYRYSDNKEKLHLYCLLSTFYLFLCLSWETREGEDPTADDVFYNTLSARTLFINYIRGVVIKLDAGLSSSPSTTSTTSTTSTSLANGSAPTRHQAVMSRTMPNALRGMYLLITALRGKWSRSNWHPMQEGMNCS